MRSTVGQIERKTQQRVVKLFRDALRYDYFGNWIVKDSGIAHDLVVGLTGR